MTCWQCKITFKPRRRTAKYCSVGCRTTSRRTGMCLVCSVCSKPIWVPKYRVDTFRFCSRSCLAIVHLPKYARFRFKPTGHAPHKYRSIKTPDGRWMREHRWVMELHLGRKLTSSEHVHHINGDALDNRPSNLIVLSNAEHQKIHVSERQISEREQD
jgi:hypothetical protein